MVEIGIGTFGGEMRQIKRVWNWINWTWIFIVVSLGGYLLVGYGKPWMLRAAAGYADTAVVMLSKIFT
jgi:hypothetical protein